ncbi:MAG: tRNA pseudouridine(55) synthase TruB [Solirubrobacteraceae bacterium]|nr:tRNA pseudouridine(55) synthase TruB [Solirubrobacteraceae bacterium]
MPPSPRSDASAAAAARAAPIPDGVLLVDKPAGPSSHGIVAAIRRAVGKGTKVGHAGTLDPFASGLMLVLIGRGTRASQFLLGLDKRYETLAQLGALSTTGDPEGEITVTGRIPASPLRLPVGEVRQTPPAYSAIKIDGERAYKRARRGEQVEVPERTITVHEFTELERDEASDRVRLALHCSSGTYVRSLVADLDDGYCLELRRTGIGPFTIDDAQPLDAFDSVASVTDAIVPLDRALGFLTTIRLGPDLADDARCGRRMPADAMPGGVPPQDEPLLLVDEAGVIAVGRSDGARVATVVGFRA